MGDATILERLGACTGEGGRTLTGAAFVVVNAVPELDRASEAATGGLLRGADVVAGLAGGFVSAVRYLGNQKNKQALYH